MRVLLHSPSTLRAPVQSQGANTSYQQQNSNLDNNQQFISPPTPTEDQKQELGFWQELGLYVGVPLATLFLVLTGLGLRGHKVANQLIREKLKEATKTDTFDKDGFKRAKQIKEFAEKKGYLKMAFLNFGKNTYPAYLSPEGIVRIKDNENNSSFYGITHLSGFTIIHNKAGNADPKKASAAFWVNENGKVQSSLHPLQKIILGCQTLFGVSEKVQERIVGFTKNIAVSSN